MLQSGFHVFVRFPFSSLSSLFPILFFRVLICSLLLFMFSSPLLSVAIYLAGPSFPSRAASTPDFSVQGLHHPDVPV